MRLRRHHDKPSDSVIDLGKLYIFRVVWMYYFLTRAWVGRLIRGLMKSFSATCTETNASKLQYSIQAVGLAVSRIFRRVAQNDGRCVYTILKDGRLIGQPSQSHELLEVVLCSISWLSYYEEKLSLSIPNNSFCYYIFISLLFLLSRSVDEYSRRGLVCKFGKYFFPFS